MESICDLKCSKQRPGFPEQPGHPLLFIRVRAANCQLINRHFLGPSGSPSWSGRSETEAKCACLQQSLHWPVPKPRSPEERRCVSGCERPAVTLGPGPWGWMSEQAYPSGGPWAASYWRGSILRATGSVGSWSQYSYIEQTNELHSMLLPLKIRNLSVLVSEVVLDFQPIACILMVSWDKLRTRSLFVLKPVSGWPGVHPPEVTPVRPTSVGLLLPLRQPRLWSRATFRPHALFEAANHSSLRTVNSSFTPRTLLKSVSQCTLNLCSLPHVMMPCFFISPGQSTSSDSGFTGLQLSAAMFLGALRTPHCLYFHVHLPQILLSSMLSLVAEHSWRD